MAISDISKRIIELEKRYAHKTEEGQDEILGQWICFVRSVFANPNIKEEVENLPFTFDYKAFAKDEKIRKTVREIIERGDETLQH